MRTETAPLLYELSWIEEEKTTAKYKNAHTLRIHTPQRCTVSDFMTRVIYYAYCSQYDLVEALLTLCLCLQRKWRFRLPTPYCVWCFFQFSVTENSFDTNIVHAHVQFRIVVYTIYIQWLCIKVLYRWYSKVWVYTWVLEVVSLASQCYYFFIVS